MKIISGIKKALASLFNLLFEKKYQEDYEEAEKKYNAIRELDLYSFPLEVEKKRLDLIDEEITATFENELELFIKSAISILKTISVKYEFPYQEIKCKEIGIVVKFIQYLNNIPNEKVATFLQQNDQIISSIKHINHIYSENQKVMKMIDSKLDEMNKKKEVLENELKRICEIRNIKPESQFLNSFI